MDRKTRKSYEGVFNFINTKIFDLSGTKRFYTDYEAALRKALKKKYPRAKHSACHFHFAQAVRRYANKIAGFMDFLRKEENMEARKIYYKLIYLPLLKADQIEPAFHELRRKAESIDRNIFQLFLKYYYRQWIRKEGPRKISVFGNETRTTSGAEGFNRNLGSYCHKHGSFVWFCVSIRNQEFMKSKEMVSFVESGGLVGCRQKRVDKV